MELNELSYTIRGVIFQVHNRLGPGLLESVYEAALYYEIQKMGLNVRTQVPVPVIYDEMDLGLGFRMDLLVENQLILEIKSVDALHDVHKKQLLTYLKLAKLKLGLLINFNVATLVDKISIIRVIN
ncbi:MAG: GxxExxY protein [Saprospiraceae bacterium]|nr:GxxExxY protein [Saprospiraceae bacterium]